jgi:hypothetical protein
VFSRCRSHVTGRIRKLHHTARTYAIRTSRCHQWLIGTLGRHALVVARHNVYFWISASLVSGAITTIANVNAASSATRLLHGGMDVVEVIFGRKQCLPHDSLFGLTALAGMGWKRNSDDWILVRCLDCPTEELGWLDGINVTLISRVASYNWKHKAWNWNSGSLVRLQGFYLGHETWPDIFGLGEISNVLMGSEMLSRKCLMRCWAWSLDGISRFIWELMRFQFKWVRCPIMDNFFSASWFLGEYWSAFATTFGMDIFGMDILNFYLDVLILGECWNLNQPHW